MEVTNSNFKEVLSSLPELIANAQFITIDTEFTGLQIRDAENLNKYDTPETLYNKDKEKVMSFIVIQYGIVIFNYNSATNSYTYRGYNFYVYPSTLFNYASFTCQASSIKLLSDSGFDFNKLFAEGIPYLTDNKVKELQDVLHDKYTKDKKVENQVVDESVKKELLEANLQDIISEIETASNYNRKEKIHIRKLNSFLRRIIYKTVHGKFGTKVFLVTNDDETMTAYVGLTNEEYQIELQRKYLSKRNHILENIGFSNVIKLIINSRKLIVGHNVLLDLMFTINQFIQPLPATLKEFAELTHFLFPKIIDTKYLAAAKEPKNLQDTNLYCLQDYFKNSADIPQIDAATGAVAFNIDDSTNHQAAYDAYVTGVCFLALCGYIGKECGTNVFPAIPDSAELTFGMNKVWIPKLIDVPICLNLENISTNPSRDNVFHISFPPEWKKDDIVNLFQLCGPLKISWINDKSAYVCFQYKYLHLVQSLKGDHSSYKLTTFKEHNGLV